MKLDLRIPTCVVLYKLERSIFVTTTAYYHASIADCKGLPRLYTVFKSGKCWRWKSVCRAGHTLRFIIAEAIFYVTHGGWHLREEGRLGLLYLFFVEVDNTLREIPNED